MMDSQLTKTVKIGDKDVVVAYRKLKGREPLDIMDKATRIDMRTGDTNFDTAELRWLFMKARISSIDGIVPDWDNMDEEMVMALTLEFGNPPISKKT